jgi:hypothetical protein
MNIDIAPSPLPVDEVFKCIKSLVHLGNELADSGLLARDQAEAVKNVGRQPVHKEPIDAIIDPVVVKGDTWWTENVCRQIINL